MLEQHANTTPSGRVERLVKNYSPESVAYKLDALSDATKEKIDHELQRLYGFTFDTVAQASSLETLTEQDREYISSCIGTIRFEAHLNESVEKEIISELVDALGKAK